MKTLHVVVISITLLIAVGMHEFLVAIMAREYFDIEHSKLSLDVLKSLREDALIFPSPTPAPSPSNSSENL